MNSSLNKETILNVEDESFFATIRNEEYNRLDNPNHHVYLDYTGGNLYPISIVNKHQEMLLNEVLGNPHSINPTSARATELVDAARKKVIEFYNAEDYVCVFTPNASGALKIVGESYPFDKESHFVILSDNHNSVNGIREFCKSKGGTTDYVPVQYDDLQINDDLLKEILDTNSGSDHNLFAFPAQSNVSGVKHDLKWIEYAQSKGYDVLLDAAAFVPTTKLDLKEVQPEFVTMSFYKIFGYPTGLGCLLIRKTVFNKLHKPWFAGGTVDVVSVAYPFFTLEDGYERFEDGTVNYLNIPTIKTGLEFIESIGIERINKRVANLTRTLISELEKLKHPNGTSVVRIFGPKDMNYRGGNIIMTFYDNEGKDVPFEVIEQAATTKNISLRTGCFCNPGLDEISHCVTSEELAKFYTDRNNKVEYKDMVNFMGKMRGATRISVGIATVEADLVAYLNFIKEYFKI